jgi:hypothetical protein
LQRVLDDIKKCKPAPSDFDVPFLERKNELVLVDSNAIISRAAKLGSE